ncbi:MAG: rhodanese-like domain-containing protein [archaeon]
MESFPPALVPLAAVSFLGDPSWIWLDVREPDEFEYGHLPDSLNIPLSRMSTDDFASFSKEQKFMVVCRSGGRSGRVVHSLREQGFVNVCNFSGGLIGYNLVAEKHVPVLMH